MCETRTHIAVYKILDKVDPTRTTVLRNTFAADMNRRYVRIIRAIHTAIVTQDVFGLLQTNVSLPGHKAYAFQTTAQKHESFMRWLRQLQDKNLLEIVITPGGMGGQPWTNMYIKDSYERGVARARYELIKSGHAVPAITPENGGVQAAMMSPFHMDRVAMMYTRTFSELKGITNAMDAQISRVLSQGMIEGKGPVQLSRALRKVIDGSGGTMAITDSLGRFIPAKRRAQTLVQTEMIRAHHQATINEYEAFGEYGVKVRAEWSTSGVGVCEDCAQLEGHEYSLEEIRGMIPRHPNCHCIALPVSVANPYNKTKGKTQTQTQPAKKVEQLAKPKRLSERQFEIVQNSSTDKARAWYQYESGLGASASFEEKTIYAYTKHGFKVNRELRFGRMEPIDRLYMRNLKISLNTLPDQPGITYRGVTPPNLEEILKSSGKGSKFQWNGFSSSSMSEHEAQKGFLSGYKERNLYYIIDGKRGKNIIDISAIRREQEVLFNAGSKFKVTKAPVFDKNIGWVIHIAEI